MVKTKAIVQSIVKQDAGNEAWQSYFKEAFPWVEQAQKLEKSDWIKRLQEEVKRGPIKVTGVHDAQQKFRSRLRTKVIERRTDENPRDMSNLTAKMPSLFPGGPLANRRS